jgi:DnaJ-class molecular chaperone
MCVVNYYRVLTIPRSASPQEVKSAYRRLAMEWHPDRNKRFDATLRFRQIQEAYECLIDPRRRTEHDASLCSEWEERVEAAADAWRARASDIDAAASAWNTRLKITPDTLLVIFTQIDGWLRRIFPSKV